MIVERLQEPTSAELRRAPIEKTLSRLRSWKMTRQKPWPGFGQPFNGQRERTRTIDLMIDHFEPKAMIETGTFLGFTTRRLADYGQPVYTVEVSPRVRTAAAAALADLENVTMIWGDSAAAVKKIGEDQVAERPFAYLDAHWEEEVPLADEVDALTTHWDTCLIAIDDFHVPGEPGYGYDVYAGVPIALSELPVPADVAIAFPTVPAAKETGARRGTVYLAKGEPARKALEAAEAEGLVAIQS